MYKKIVLYLVILFLFAGCSIQRAMPPVKTYKLHVDTKTQRFHDSRCTKDVLKVMGLKLNSIATSNNIYYGIGNYYINSYTQSQWLQYPSFMINSSLISALQKSHMFKAVLSYDAQSSADLLLEYNIIDFVQHFNKAKTKSYVDVKMDFLLINAQDNKLIASTLFSKKIQATSLNALGGVKAFSKSTGDIISKVEMWLNHICTKRKAL